jgi:LysM repeat protein
LKTRNKLKLIFLSLIISTLGTSCGLIEKFRNPEKPTDSKAETTEDAKPTSESDELFAKTMNDSKGEKDQPASDAPSNITADNQAAEKDLKSLEDDFAAPKKEAEKQVKVEEALPEIKDEAPPEMASSSNENAGKVMTYKVKKGETLMQIAFKIYGDLSKWKHLKQMNQAKFSKNSALVIDMQLKYTAPEKTFVWNPEGTPYMIKTGETLGVISKSVYQTPKKWKQIWENNKPLIKNPNVIYTGFTLYYKGDGLANYVQPKNSEQIVFTKTKKKNEEAHAIEEVKVEKAIANLEKIDSSEIDLTTETKSAPIREEMKYINQELNSDEIKDEALSN